jgi:hypothetical protein
MLSLRSSKRIALFSKSAFHPFQFRGSFPSGRYLPLVGEDVMKPDRLERLTRWGAGALMLLLVHGFFAPRAAWAGCSHLVVSRSDRLLEFNQIDPLVAGDSTTLLPDERGPKRPAPCSGPGCSKRVPIPIPTTFPAPDDTHQWGTLGIPAIRPAASPFDRMTDEPVRDSSRQETAVFHPPRA